MHSTRGKHASGDAPRRPSCPPSVSEPCPEEEEEEEVVVGTVVVVGGQPSYPPSVPPRQGVPYSVCTQGFHLAAPPPNPTVSGLAVGSIRG